MNSGDNSKKPNRLVSDIEKALDDKNNPLHYHTLKQVENVINPERHKERVATYAFERLKEQGKLHLVVEYLDCRYEFYDVPEYEKFRKFREDLWARAKAECEAIH